MWSGTAVSHRRRHVALFRHTNPPFYTVTPCSVCAASSGGYLANIDCGKVFSEMGQAPGEGSTDLAFISKGERAPLHRFHFPRGET